MHAHAGGGGGGYWEEEVKGTVFTNQIHLEVVVEDLILIITVLREDIYTWIQ